MIVTGGGAGTAGAAIAGGHGVAGVTPGWPRACGVAAASGGTATVCVTVAGMGSGGCGSTGSADAVAPAKPTTAAMPAAAPPARTRQRRAISFIDGGPSSAVRGSSHLRQAPTVSAREVLATRAGTDLESTSDRSATEPIPTRGRRGRHTGCLYPVHVTESPTAQSAAPTRPMRTPRSTATPRSWRGRSSTPGSRHGRESGTFNVPNPVGSLAPAGRLAGARRQDVRAGHVPVPVG